MSIIESGGSRSCSGHFGRALKREIQLDVAHVLFIDIVGYSKLSINEQNAAVDELTPIIPRGSPKCVQN
jgi:hypothetical protein